jgi:uncharacterized membrane protein YoaK (UPF0700 family)
MARISGHQASLQAPRWRTPETIRDVLLVGLAVTSGAVDAIAWLTLGKVFTAFMTGNLVFLGLDAAGAAGPGAVRVAISLAAFAAGVLLAVPIVKTSRGAGVWPRRISVTLGVSALAQAAFFVVWVATSGEPSTNEAYLLVGLWALAMGFQSGAVMSLSVSSVLTTAVTGTYIGLMSDLAGWSRSVTQERRFAGVLAGLFAGAFAGGYLIDHARNYAPVLPLIITVLVIAAAEYSLKPAR